MPSLYNTTTQQIAYAFEVSVPRSPLRQAESSFQDAVLEQLSNKLLHSGVLPSFLDFLREVTGSVVIESPQVQVTALLADGENLGFVKALVYVSIPGINPSFSSSCTRIPTAIANRIRSVVATTLWPVRAVGDKHEALVMYAGRVVSMESAEWGF